MRSYDVFDVEDRDDVPLNELVLGLGQVLGGTQEEKSHFFFTLYDTDGAGNLDKQKVGRLHPAVVGARVGDRAGIVPRVR